MKKKYLYESIAINSELLANNFKDIDSSKSFHENFEKFMSGEEEEIFPKGKIVGVKFNSFVDKEVNELGFCLSRTKISISDNFTHAISDPSDIRDFETKNGDYLGNFKKVDFDVESNTKIIVVFETKGERFPICGEFIFLIEDTCGCPTN